MHFNFTPVSLDGLDEYYRLWDLCPLHSLDYSPVNLWGWQEHYGLEWCFEGDLCWIRQTMPCDTVLWAPCGDWAKADWKRLLEPGMEFIRVPDSLAALWREQIGPRVAAEPDRGQWEYLYLATDLATLPGNRFHKKRNHVSAFVKACGAPDYHPMDARMVEDCLALQDEWCQWHDCEGSPSLAAENSAINQVLAHCSAFRNLCGGSLYVDGGIAAFALGERLDRDSVGVHFEKGLASIRGIYQVINQIFVQRECADVRWVNRAQDLNEEGLRHAKESYRPAGFLQKSRVAIA